MSIFPFLQLQPIEPTNDDTISDLDVYQPDDVIDLTQDITEEELEADFARLLSDDEDQITFSNE